MKVEVSRYRKPDGYASRYWAVFIDGELLAVTLYRRGAEAVARALNPNHRSPHVQDPATSENAGTGRASAAAGLASRNTR